MGAMKLLLIFLVAALPLRAKDNAVKASTVAPNLALKVDYIGVQVDLKITSGTPGIYSLLEEGSSDEEKRYDALGRQRGKIVETSFPQVQVGRIYTLYYGMGLERKAIGSVDMNGVEGPIKLKLTAKEYKAPEPKKPPPPKPLPQAPQE